MLGLEDLFDMEVDEPCYAILTGWSIRRQTLPNIFHDWQVAQP
jgi:hypothetical protein